MYQTWKGKNKYIFIGKKYFPYDEKHLVSPNYPKQINGDLRALSIKKGLINMYIPLNAIVLECINRILFMGDKSPPPRSLSGNGKQ